MKKYLILLVLIMALSGCGNSSEWKKEDYTFTETQEPVWDFGYETETPEEDIIKDKQVLLHLVFGNGEELTTEIINLAFPREYYGEYDYDIYDFTTSWKELKFKDDFNNLKYNLNGVVALLSTNEHYDFSEAKSGSYDEFTNTITLYLWRDTPYETEKQTFSTIGK